MSAGKLREEQRRGALKKQTPFALYLLSPTDMRAEVSSRGPVVIEALMSTSSLYWNPLSRSCLGSHGSSKPIFPPALCIQHH